MCRRASSISLLFIVVIFSHHAISAQAKNGDNHNGKSVEKSKHKSILFYGSHTKSDEIVWLLNQLIDILNEMVSGLELDPTLLHNYHFRQILAHMIRRIDFILEHFENMRELPRDIKSALHRLDCVRIRLSNYIGQKSGQHQDDSICYESGMMTSTKSPIMSGGASGGDQNNQIMVIITQIVYIMVQIVNRMGGPSDGSDQKHKTTMAGGKTKTTTWSPDMDSDATTPFNWDDMVNQYGSTNGPLTNTPDWNDLISQIMNQMGSTIAGAVDTGNGVTQAPGDTTTVDWGELISAVVGEIEKQYGSTPSGMAPPASNTDTGGMDMITPMVWDQSKDNNTMASNSNTDWNPWPMFSTQSSSNSGSTQFDVQGCIDSIMQIVNDINNQLPDNSRMSGSSTTTTTTAQSVAATQDLSDIMSGILGQFG